MTAGCVTGLVSVIVGQTSLSRYKQVCTLSLWRLISCAESHCIYQFTFDCGSSYIGGTDRCLGSRVTEHIPKYIKEGMAQPRSSDPRTDRIPSSSVAKRLLSSGHREYFHSVQSAIQSPKSEAAEAVAINRLKPPFMCRNSYSSTLDCHGISQTDPTNTACMLSCIVCVSVFTTNNWYEISLTPSSVSCYWFAIDKTRNDIILKSLSSEFTVQTYKRNQML